LVIGPGQGTTYIAKESKVLDQSKDGKFNQTPPDDFSIHFPAGQSAYIHQKGSRRNIMWLTFA